MKILIIGSKGMLGHDVVKECNKLNYETTNWDLEDIDITKDISKINEVNPEIIINCAAYTNVDLAETEKEKSYSINVKGVENLTNYCKNKNIILIQISTDYVFDGTKSSYDENDEKNPINYYGLTKSLGEDFILNNLEKFYIVRTSWLFGKNGKNFVSTMIKLFSEKNKIKVVYDQIGCPTYTKDLTKGILNLIEQKSHFGIYHLSNNKSCSWFEFAIKIKELTNSNCIIEPCTSEEFSCVAKRPNFSILNNNKTNKLRDWEESLKDYLEVK
ncbi:dTDP-4-dehydrorhamnose reductase [Candidatus Woesearchaeota archaeon]|nr:dTDP-4-dehydrorhamnose reductase [Candidatus Woesearchaeota archaeon]